jgi:hypothetical protein
VSLAKAISFFANVRKPTRQPMLWAALAYGTGIVCCVYAWRPPVWWMVAASYFLSLHFTSREGAGGWDFHSRWALSGVASQFW